MSIDQDTVQCTAEAKAMSDYLYAAALSIWEDSSDDEAHQDAPETDAAGQTQHATDNTPRQCPTTTEYKGKVVQEAFCQHPDDPSLFDELPNSDAGVTIGNSDLQGSRHFWPPLGQALIPKKQFGLPWQSVTGKPYEFQRGDGQRRETLKVDFSLRLLNPATNKYVGTLHCFQLLEGMDPNDKPWKDKYSVAINQWRLRRDAEYVKLLSWGRWTNAEICALYTSINNFCRINGVSKFDAHDTGLTQYTLRVFLDNVNAMSKKKRRMDVVRSVIRNASGRMHKPLFDLATEAAAMRARREKGKLVVEVKPLHAILLSNFPSGDALSTPARAIARTARKRKARSDDEDEADATETGNVQERSKRARSNL